MSKRLSTMVILGLVLVATWSLSAVGQKTEAPSAQEIEQAVAVFDRLALSHTTKGELKKAEAARLGALVGVGALAGIEYKVDIRSLVRGLPHGDAVVIATTLQRLNKAKVANPGLTFTFLCHYEQAQAHDNLRTIVRNERAYHKDHGRYSDDIKTVLTTLRDGLTTTNSYNYEVVRATTDSLIVRALGHKDYVKGDVWEVTHLSDVPQVKTDACGRF